MKNALLGLAIWAAITIGVVAWLTSQADISAEDRTGVILGTAGVTAFACAAAALALRKA